MSQDINSNKDGHEGIDFLNGFIVISEIMRSENEACDADFSEL